MPSLNRVELIGHLGRDPEMRYTQGGKPVTSCSLAVANGKDKEPEWVPLIAWEKDAENLNSYGSKGKLLYVEGRLQTRSWEKDGVKHTRTEVVITRWQLLDRKPEGQAAKPAATVVDDDELPF